MMTLKTYFAPSLVALAAAAALTACGRDDDQKTAGQRLDSAVATAEQKANEMTSDAKQGAAEAKDKVAEAANQAKESGREMLDKASNAVSDAAITTSVNAELAKDNLLRATKINVDTSNGRVLLKGTAPDAASRDRATQLAMAVQGVVSVDNRLTVSPTM